MNVQSMYQGEEVQEDGEDTDKGYNSYKMVVGKKEKGYLEDSSNMDMGRYYGICHKFSSSSSTNV